jgi:hypothetical protein
MGHAANIPRPRRVAALVCVVGLHAAVLLYFFTGKATGLTPPPVPGAMTVMSLPEYPAAKPPKPPKMPSKVVEKVQLLIQEAVSPQPDSSANAASASGCTTLDSVTQALLADPAFVTAVLQAPPEARSIADAVMVWNGQWSEAASATDAPLAPVRASVLHSLVGLDAKCLDEPIAGPRLVPVPAGTGTMFLVFGSGTPGGRRHAPGDGSRAQHDLGRRRHLSRTQRSCHRRLAPDVERQHHREGRHHL